MAAGLDAAEALVVGGKKLGAKDAVTNAGRFVVGPLVRQEANASVPFSGAYKAARKLLEPGEPAFKIVGADSGRSSSDFGLTNELILPSSYAANVELNLTPFVSNVGSYLQNKGIIPDNDWLALGVDMALDFGNLLPFVGQVGAVSKTGRIAKTASTVLAGGLKGKTGAELVDVLTQTIRTAGEVGNAAPELMAAAQAGDKAALDAVLKAAIGSGKMAPEAADLAGKLQKQKKAIAAILEKAEEFSGLGELGPRLFQQESRVAQLAAGQRTSRLAVTPLSRAWRDPAAFARQTLLGITYEGERFLMPAANAVAGIMDKLAPLKGIPMLQKGLRVADDVARSAEAGALLEAAERLPGGITFFQRNRLASRLRLGVAMPNTEQLGELAEGVTDELVSDMLKKATGRERLTANEVSVARDGILAKIAESQSARDATILAKRDAAIARATTEATEAWQAVGMMDSAMAEADLADLRNWHSTFVDDWIVQDPQGVGMALTGRASAMDRVAAAVAQADTEIVRNIHPRRQDSEAVLDLIQHVPSHPDLFELREGRLVLTASNDKILKEAPLLHDVLTGKGYTGLEKTLRETGLHPEIAGIIGSYRDMLDAAKDTLLQEGVIEGVLTNYFVRSGKFTKAFFKEFGLDEKSAGRLFDVASERLAAGKADAVTDMVFGAASGGRRPFEDLMQQAAAGTLSLQEARKFSEGMLKRLMDAGMYIPGTDSVAMLTNYMSSAHKAIIANKIWRDLPNMPSRVMRPELELLMGKGKALAVSEAALSGTREAAKATAKDADLINIEINRRRLEALRKELASADPEHFETVARIKEDIESAVDELAASQLKHSQRVQMDFYGLGEGAKPVTESMVGGLKRVYSNASDIPEWARKAGLYAKVEGTTRHFPEPSALSRQATRAHLRTLAAADIKAARRNAVDRAVEELAGQTEFAVGKKKLQVRGARQPMGAQPDFGAVPLEAAWVRSGHVPGKIQNAAEIGKAIRQRTKALFEEEAETVFLGKAAGKISKKPAGAVARRPEVWVIKTDFGHLTETFNLWRRGDYSAFANGYDNLNAAWKTVVLFGDLFYFNALSTISVMTDPKAIGKALLDDFGRLRAGVEQGGLTGALGRAVVAPISGASASNAVAQAAVGAGAGLAAAPAFGAEDASQYTGFALAGALWGGALGTALRKGREARKLAFNPMSTDSLFWMGHGGATGRPDDRAIGKVPEFLRSLEEKLVRKHGGAYIGNAGILRSARHLVEQYEDTLFGVLHNGGKQAYFELAFRPRLEALRKTAGWEALAEKERFFQTKQLATEVMQFANTAFSSQRYSMLFKDPHTEKLLSRAFIAPQWMTSRINLATSMLANMGPLKSAVLGGAMGSLVELADSGFETDGLSRGPLFGAAAGLAGNWWSSRIVARMGVRGDVYRGMALRLSASALVGGWTVYNLLNYAMTGRWLHENEEGHKLHVALPNGQYYDMGKPFVEAYEWSGVLEKETFPAPVISRVGSKLAPIPSAFRIVFNRHYFGGQIIEAEDGPSGIIGKYGEIAFQSAAPIGLRATGEALYEGAFGEGLDQGQLNRALSGMAGLPIKGRAGGFSGARFDPSFLQSAIGSRPPSLGNPSNPLAPRF